MRATTFQRTKKIYPLTSVRFFGALYVVFHHTAKDFSPAFYERMLVYAPRSLWTGVLFKLPASVSFFFLLSGYVLTVVYLRDGKRVDKGKFFAARFARIYPLYFVTLVLDTPHLLLDKVHRLGPAIGVVKTAGIFLGHTVMLKAWYGQRLRGIDDPNWSLSAETFFYLCFPMLGFALCKLQGARLWIVALCLYAGGQLLVVSVQAHPWLWVPLLHLPTFALGVLLARWQSLQSRREEDSPSRTWRVYGVMALVGVCLSLGAAASSRFSIGSLLFTGLLAPVFAGLIWALSSADTLIARLLCASWLVALGNASFALYLIHTPMLHLFEYLHWTALPGIYPVYLALTIGLSLLSFYAFETPVRLRLLRWFHLRSLERLEEASIAQ